MCRGAKQFERRDLLEIDYLGEILVALAGTRIVVSSLSSLTEVFPWREHIALGTSSHNLASKYTPLFKSIENQANVLLRELQVASHDCDFVHVTDPTFLQELGDRTQRLRATDSFCGQVLGNVANGRHR